MKNLLAQAGGLALGAVLFASSASFAQVAQPTIGTAPKSAPSPSLTIGPTDAEAAAVPEWLVWKAFHRSLEFYNNQSPQHVQDLLSAKIGIQQARSATVLSTGVAYLQELDRIDAEVRQQIFTRYRVNRLPPANLPRPAFRAGAPALTAAAATTQLPGPSIRDLAIKDGFYAEVESRKASALAAHKKEIAATLGASQLQAMERFVETEVAPAVKVFGAGQLVAAPDRSTQGRVELQSATK